MVARRSVFGIAREGLRRGCVMNGGRADRLMRRKIRELWRIIELFSGWPRIVW